MKEHKITNEISENKNILNKNTNNSKSPTKMISPKNQASRNEKDIIAKLSSTQLKGTNESKFNSFLKKFETPVNLMNQSLHLTSSNTQ